MLHKEQQAVPQLVVLEGSCIGQVFRLWGNSFTIGRAVTNTIVLRGDSTISTIHAEIGRDNFGRFRITDHRSANGVFVNDSRVSARTLHHGDEIQLGNNRLKFIVST